MHADLSGEGARRFGGRWNRRGRPVVYMAEHPALAVLEVRVHLDLPLELLPDDYVLVRVALPDAHVNEIGDIPDDTVAAGDTWLAAEDTPVLRVPSVLVPHARNLLLNPLHAGRAAAAVTSIEPFRFDPRLWQPS
jgi:RES domain-containing protein